MIQQKTNEQNKYVRVAKNVFKGALLVGALSATMGYCISCLERNNEELKIPINAAEATESLLKEYGYKISGMYDKNNDDKLDSLVLETRHGQKTVIVDQDFNGEYNSIRHFGEVLWNRETNEPEVHEELEYEKTGYPADIQKIWNLLSQTSYKGVKEQLRVH